MLEMSKANFWGPLKSKYPDQMEDFLKWIDEYKRRIGWRDLFNIGTFDEYCHDVKFHDLPPAMQLGIFIQYTIETGDVTLIDDDLFSMEDWLKNIEKWFEVKSAINRI